MEIEKKYLLKSLPDRRILGKGIPVLQGYLIIEPYEMRVRSYGTKYYLTIKSEGSLTRREWNCKIPKWVFEALWPHTESRRVEKTRYLIPYQNLTLELDEYHGKLEGLIILECEFPDEKTAQNFVLPIWAKDAIDVTADDHYKNKYLAVYGLQIRK